jgi:hypothetical protein
MMSSLRPFACKCATPSRAVILIAQINRLREPSSSQQQFAICKRSFYVDQGRWCFASWTLAFDFVACAADEAARPDGDIKVRGTVVDAETGKALPAFTLTEGRQDQYNAGRFNWSAGRKTKHEEGKFSSP